MKDLIPFAFNQSTLTFLKWASKLKPTTKTTTQSLKQEYLLMKEGKASMQSIGCKKLYSSPSGKCLLLTKHLTKIGCKI